MQNLEHVRPLIEKIHVHNYRSVSTASCAIIIFAKNFHRLSVLNYDVHQLYTYGNNFLLILTYYASSVQNRESVHPLIEKIYVYLYKSMHICL